MPAVRVAAPDGSFVDFPEGTSDAVITQVMKQNFLAPSGGEAQPSMAVQGTPGMPMLSEPPAPAPSRFSQAVGAVGDALNLVDRGVRSAAKGAVGIYGLPYDLLNMAPMLAGRKPFLEESPSTYMKRGLDVLNDATYGAVGLGGIAPAHEPQSAVQRGVERVGEEVGAASVPVAGMLTAATHLGAEGVKELPRLARYFVEPALVSNTSRYLGKEAGAAVAAGTGAAGLTEVAHQSGLPNDWRMAATDLAGALGGLGLYGVAGHVLPKLGDIVQAVRGAPSFTNKVVREGATDVLAEAYGLPSARLNEKGATDTAPIVEAIQRGNKVADTIPGYTESLADRTGNAGIAGLEYSRQSGPNSGLFTARRSDNTKAVDAALNRSEPQGQPGALREALEGARDVRLNEAASDRTLAQQRFQDASNRLQTVMSAEARGADIRAPLEDALTAARDVERGAWEGIGGVVDPQPLAQRFEAVTQSLTPSEQRAAAQAQAAIGTPATFDGPVDLRNITSLRGELTDTARRLRPDSPNAARIVDRYVDELDNYTSGALDPALRARYDEARAVSRDLNDRFTRPQTGIAQALDRTQGQYTVPANDVARRFVPTNEGRTADFEALLREAGNDPRARGALQDQIRAEVTRQRVLDRPDTAQAFQQRYERVLREFPELNQEIANAAGSRRLLNEAETAEQGLQRQLGTPTQPGTGNVGRYLRFGDERSENAMKGVIASPRPAQAMDELLNFAGNTPEAVEGGRRIFWNLMQKAGRRGGESTADMSGTQPWMPKKLNDFLNDPPTRAVAERLYRDDPEHLDNIRQIAEALQGVDLRTRARAPNSSGTAQAMAGGGSNILTPETVQSRLYAYKRGQVSGTFLISSMAAVAARRSVRRAQTDAINKLVDEALLNPDAAATLLKENNPANRAILARKAKAWIGNEASTVADMLMPSDAVRDAVTRRDDDAR